MSERFLRTYVRESGGRVISEVFRRVPDGTKFPGLMWTDELARELVEETIKSGTEEVAADAIPEEAVVEDWV